MLSLLAVGASALVPTARRYGDLWAAIAAREATAALLADARVAAVRTGSARLVIQGRPWRAEARSGDSLLTAVALEAELGVTVELAGGKERAEIAFGPLGLGIVASETVWFRRGEASKALVVSGYGRVRRP